MAALQIPPTHRAAATAPSYGVELDSAPGDGVSRLQFSPTGAGTSSEDHLLVSSWDSSLRLYGASSNTLKLQVDLGAPVLDCCFLGGEEGTALSGGLDGSVKRGDLGRGVSTSIGEHEQGVRCMSYLREADLCVTGSWDRNVCTWDPRRPAAGAGTSGAVHRIRQEGKVFSMATHAHRLVVAASNRRIAVYDVRRLDMKEAEIEMNSPLKYQTRCVRCFPNGLGFAVASVEGRVAMEYFSRDADTQAKKYAFKCHRRVEDGKEIVFPVNCIAFHPSHGTFATGGCDGVVNVWDGENKKRLYQYARYRTSIADLCFNSNGTRLAVAASYTFEQGEKDHDDAIFVRQVQENEVKPKPRGQKK